MPVLVTHVQGLGHDGARHSTSNLSSRRTVKSPRCRRLSGRLLHLALDLLFGVDVASVGDIAIDHHRDSPTRDWEDRPEEARIAECPDDDQHRVDGQVHHQVDLEVVLRLDPRWRENRSLG